MSDSAEDRRQSDSVANARRRVGVVKESFGPHHPEYAICLNQLALLLIMQGNSDEAEPLLREALEIRRDALGETHADYATNLSSLSGLLWARGALDESEPMLRRAYEVRCETLGPAHPKAMVSLSSLEQLLQARRERDAAALADAAGTSTERDLRSTGALDAREIEQQLELIGDRFADLGDRLATAALELTSRGSPPSEVLTALWIEARDEFHRFRDRVVAAAADLEIATQEGGPRSLEDLAAQLPAIGAAEERRASVEARKRVAIDRLDRVEALTCTTDMEYPPLIAARQAARALREAIKTSRPGAISAEAVALADGAHPFVALLTLATGDDAAGDAEWAEAFTAIEREFGTPLAVAAARSRLRS